VLVLVVGGVEFTRGVHMPRGDLWTGLLGRPQLWTAVCTAWRGRIGHSGL